MLGWDPSGQWLATAGYAVFLPNPRGGKGHGHDFAVRVAGAVALDEWTDICAGIDLLIAGGVADPDRLGIGGSSGREGTGPHRHDRLSPISYASKVRTAVLILHGGSGGVPFSGSAAFAGRSAT